MPGALRHADSVGVGFVGGFGAISRTCNTLDVYRRKRKVVLEQSGRQYVVTLLVWLLLSGAMAELFVGGGLLRAITSYRQTTDYERMALMVVAWELVAMAIVLFLLAFVPHAVLLSALGTITPDSYIDSFVIMAITGVCIMSLTYGMVTGRYPTFVDAFGAAASGVATTAPLVIVYLLAAELYSSVVWIFT